MFRYFIAILVLLMTTYDPARAQATNDAEGPVRSIRVTGQGSVSVSPDMVLLTFAVETNGITAQEASGSNAEISQSVADVVRAQLGEKDRLTTSGYSLTPRYGERGNRSGQPPEIVGYTARNEIRVETREIEGLGEMIDAGIDAGANRLNNLRFELEDRNPALQQALENAGAQARGQAESIARALGVKLGRVLSATTDPAPIPIAHERVAMMRAESSATPIDAGELEVRASLHVVYAIEE